MAATTPEAPSLYTRQSTGLVRDIGMTSSVALNISFMSLPVALLVATQAPFAFPGASLPWLVVIAGVLSLLPALLYGSLGKAMPRSGGDYVFVSRILNPMVGFAANFNMAAWAVMGMALFASLIAPFGLSAALSTIGAATGNHHLVSLGTTVTGKPWEAGIGVVALLVTALLMSLDLRTAMRIFQLIFFLSLVGVAVAAVLTIIHGRPDFEGAVRRFGGSYAGMIRSARGAGYSGVIGPTSWSATFTASGLAFAALGYAIVSTYAGGEVRSPRKTILRSMVLSVVIASSIVIVLMALAARTFGQHWLGAATYLSNNASAKYPLPSTPFYFFFVAMLTKSTALITVMGVSFALAIFALLPPIFLIATRSLFAWSFDRILPDRVSKVNDRTHSPLVANAVVLVIGIGFLFLIVYGPSKFLTILYSLIAGQILTFIVVAVAAAIFPFRRREMWMASPINRLWGRIPVITIIGIVSVGVYLFFLIPLLVNPTLGANARPGLVTMAIIGIVPFFIYAISYFINRARGVDLGLAFTSLPPE